MTKKLIIPAILACALAACNGPAAPSNESADARDGITVKPAKPVKETTVATDKTVDVRKPAPKSPTTFPAAFQGRWGMTANDCDPARDDNKGLLTVSAGGLKFYESRAKVVTIAPISDNGLAADLTFNGEGQTWSSKTVFQLVDGGKTLLRTEEEPASSYRYAKCPAA
ncbi:hypothetical protein [Sphingomonas alpina]|uniref:Uncharacterized protein n=1 Tax=Sphingomonas alpina TaxID=653931 RepID=A0A7H0LDV5_9SPHN|nr:hypothetical protein [Sphingomonas alpina]QNQ07858.1 hypothetical protein H3Z74_13725 [Sphingomonas alpina]